MPFGEGEGKPIRRVAACLESVGDGSRAFWDGGWRAGTWGESRLAIRFFGIDRALWLSESVEKEAAAEQATGSGGTRALGGVARTLAAIRRRAGRESVALRDRAARASRKRVDRKSVV